jgi:hypothetical protein
MKVSLTKWASRLDPPPHINTLRAWARDGKRAQVPLGPRAFPTKPPRRMYPVLSLIRYE